MKYQTTQKCKYENEYEQYLKYTTGEWYIQNSTIAHYARDVSFPEFHTCYNSQDHFRRAELMLKYSLFGALFEIEQALNRSPLNREYLKFYQNILDIESAKF